MPFRKILVHVECLWWRYSTLQPILRQKCKQDTSPVAKEHQNPSVNTKELVYRALDVHEYASTVWSLWSPWQQYLVDDIRKLLFLMHVMLSLLHSLSWVSLQSLRASFMVICFTNNSKLAVYSTYSITKSNITERPSPLHTDPAVL